MRGPAIIPSHRTLINNAVFSLCFGSHQALCAMQRNAEAMTSRVESICLRSGTTGIAVFTGDSVLVEVRLFTDTQKKFSSGWLQRHRDLMDFLGSHDCPVTEQTLHTVAIKFWYQQPVQTCASLVVFPPDATFSAMHGMMADRGRFRQRWHRDLAYCLPLGLTGKTQNKTAQTTYGSMLQRRIFRGGGPVVLEGSDRLVETMLTKLGFLDTELNADIKEAMFVFVNVSHNKTNLRRIGLLDRAALTVAEASAMLQGAFLSNAGYGWQHAPADCTARNVLLKVLRWHPDKWSPAVQRFPAAEQPVLLSRVLFGATWYVQNFKQVLDFEDKHGFGGLGSEEYHALTNGIFNQHRGTMLDVAKGVFEFNEDLNKLFGPDLELAELRHLDLIQDIERSLDEFFTNRLTLRLMISHVQALNANKTVNSDGEAMVGVVNVSTHPITILSRAYVATRFMCMRDFQMAPDLLVNGTMHDEYVLRQVDYGILAWA
ncbi:[Pyruvate dehydrogenase (acetyl-transferring)] kinase isozyme 3, mitochondrial [Symbiodinium microadriaticum]|uniref:Protein-serine/threonine kinase n=2 Tax=Symbiodinium TaxID=2949 RepID=A0A1Q9F6V8_SYMMI|nr:[Pyruvate dehydrogenase (acetyl-transferring)] kinase isozyme 3, mitochondrial [Symbiodinium microadriaticum]